MDQLKISRRERHGAFAGRNAGTRRARRRLASTKILGHKIRYDGIFRPDIPAAAFAGGAASRMAKTQAGAYFRRYRRSGKDGFAGPRHLRRAAVIAF